MEYHEHGKMATYLRACALKRFSADKRREPLSASVDYFGEWSAHAKAGSALQWVSGDYAILKGGQIC